jgi:hypothetical protein
VQRGVEIGDHRRTGGQAGGAARARAGSAPSTKRATLGGSLLKSVGSDDIGQASLSWLAIEAAIEWVRLAVDGDERSEKLVVDCRRRRAWFVAMGDGRMRGQFLQVQIAQPDRSQKRCAARVDVQRVGDLQNRALQHVGVKLAPQVGTRAAAHHAHLRQPAADELLDIDLEPARVERHALDRRCAPDRRGVVCSERLCQPPRTV